MQVRRKHDTRGDFAFKHLLVREADDPNFSGALEPFVAVPVFLWIMARAVDLDDEVLVRQVEIGYLR
jgi:hypothetical protein